MTDILQDARRLAAARIALTRSIDRGSVVLSSRLAEVFLNVPRHPFVPVFYRRDGERFTPWRVTDGDPEGWLDQVYSDDSLITEVDGLHAEQAGPEGVTGVPTSSSTAPGLMADMLDALDVRPGTTVLEIGTGSGYNAALLSRLAGDGCVASVDRSAALVALARDRLAATGHTPFVRQGDGAAGLPGRAPYDRIIATCSVRHIPPAWLEQLLPGGVMVVPVKGALAGGLVVRLTKLPDGTAAGHVLHTPASFMPLESGPRRSVPGPGAVPSTAVRRRSPLPASVLDDWTFSFFADIRFPAGTVRGHGRDSEGRRVTTLYDPSDGSGAHIAEPSRGGSEVTVFGPHDLWSTAEEAHEEWLRLHRPRREWFTIEAAPGRQTLAHTPPGGPPRHWPLTG